MLAAVSSVKASCKAATVSLVMAAPLARNLLDSAMEAAAVGQDMVGAKADRLAVREQRLDDGDGRAVVDDAILRHYHRRVADVEIHVAGGDDVALGALDAAGGGQVDEVELRGAQALRGIAPDGLVGVVL